MGLGFSQFCLRTRASQAAHLLVSTPLSVETIAGRLGFTDDSHLHRAFSKYYPCTPTDYRRRFGGG